MADWPKVQLGEMLSRSAKTVLIQPDVDYREITVRLWGKGVVLRGISSGAGIAGSRRFVANAGQFILSRIDARNGAMGLVPPKLDNAAVTSDFPLFDINVARVEPAFLGWLSKTRNFVELCQRASEGTTNRVRLQEDRFLDLEILLPPLAEQQQIVARIEELAAQIQEARRLRREAVEEGEALVHSALNSILSELDRQPSTERGPLQLFAEVNPSRTGKVNLKSTDLVSFIPMKAVDDVTGMITTPETRMYAEVSKGYTWFKDSDVIFARITPCMQNGKAALARELVNGVGFGSTEFHVLRVGSKLLPEWVYTLVRHKVFREDAAAHFKGTAGQQRVPESFLREKVVPVPPIPEQRRIVAELDALQSQVDALKRLQAETAAELDALLPAILDKAFKGEL